MDTTSYHENVGLITGGTRGLGYATAKRLGRAGVTVLIGARDLDAGRRAAMQLEEDGVQAVVVPLDVDSATSVRDASDRVARDFGSLDILINNAGILPEATTPDADRPLDAELFARTLRTNVIGPALVTQHFLPLLEKSSAGRIVNVSSTVGSLAAQTDPSSPYYDLVVPAYQASKAALNSMTIGLSKALAGTDIKVNSVCPGWVQTDLGGPENRAAAPTSAEDASEIVARAALLDPAGPTGAFFDGTGVVPW